jgi:hypothetical protein
MHAMSATVLHSELLRAGLTSAAIASLLKQGAIHRLRRSVYTYEEADGPLAQHMDLVAATWRVVDPSNVLSHTTAALMYGLPVRVGALERVTMTRTTSGHADKGPKLLVRDTRLTHDEIGTLDGMAVTTLTRTVSDIARTEPLTWGMAAADAALREGMGRDDLLAAIGRHARLHGLRKARHIAATASLLSESPAESISRANMQISGVPMPVQQAEIFDESGQFLGRVDFLWPDHGVIGEVDGAIKYEQLLRPGQSPREAVMEEKAREAKFRRLGYIIERWDWNVATKPGQLAAVIRGALGSSQGPVRLGDITLPPQSHQRSV